MDAKALLCNQKVQDGKCLRWIFLLQDYDIEFKHWKGKYNSIANFLSWLEQPADQRDHESTDSESDVVKPAPTLAPEHVEVRNMRHDAHVSKSMLMADMIITAFQVNGRQHCLDTMKAHIAVDDFLGPILEYKETGYLNENWNYAMKNLLKTTAAQH